MSTQKLNEIIDSAAIEDLRELIRKGIESIPEFKTLSEQILCPPLEDVDFRRKLSQAVDRETKEFHSRYDTRTATDWSDVYYDLIKPWGENAETLSDEKLYALIEGIIKEVAMTVCEEDFYGDDWYGDDFSGDIASIMDTLENLIRLLLIRDDVGDKMLKSLKMLIQSAQKNSVIDDYIGSPYVDLLDLINLRMKEGKVTSGLFDMIVEKDSGDSTGKWICMEIDFLRSKGHAEKARKIMEEDGCYPEVSYKSYEELIEKGDWKGAIHVLDNAQDMKESGQMRYSPNTPDWLELKQAILLEHGTLEERIENLQQLFLTGNDKSKYYKQLKEIVKADEWKDFYHRLLNRVKGYDTLNQIAPFLIEESEFDWLYRLVAETEAKDRTNYRTPLKYAEALKTTHRNQVESQLTRTIMAYAADRYAPKKKVNSYKYEYFRDDLESLAAKGYHTLLKELLECLLKEYSFRPSLAKHLRSITVKP
ncbi:MAG: hypothetical protein K2I92_01230 [Muribaculaceae bacterium]|nr:hypothetical protein [Muribaculaceae bacterium]